MTRDVYLPVAPPRDRWWFRRCVVNNETDKTLAGMRARGVSHTFSVENELQLEK